MAKGSLHALVVLFSSSSRSGTGTTERGLPKLMLELDKLKLVSGFLDSLEAVDFCCLILATHL